MGKSNRPPLSPEAAAVLKATGLSRRTLLRGALAGGAFAATGSVLAACGVKGTATQQPNNGAYKPACTVTDVSATEKKVVFSNWPLYIDVDDNDSTKHPTLDRFATSSGLSITYQEDINDNVDFYGKTRVQMGACQSIERDIIVLTDWMASRWVNFGWVQQLDRSAMPNFSAHLSPTLTGRVWDKQTHFAAPWASGMTGLAYNAGVTGPVSTIDDLLTKPELKGKVTLLTEMNDTAGLLLLSMGKDPQNFTDADFDAAMDKMHKAVTSGQIRKFTGNDYKEDLVKGDIAACMAWSGDVFQLAAENDKIKYVTPDHGAMLWSDNMLIPATSTHKANAQKVMDYYYDPAIAAELAAYVNYICPVPDAKAELAKIDQDLANSEFIFPTSATLSKTHGFQSLAEDKRKSYETKFAAAMTG
jgi:spermidine/putrescine transport system substrate-binding protein